MGKNQKILGRPFSSLGLDSLDWAQTASLSRKSYLRTLGRPPALGATAHPTLEELEAQLTALAALRTGIGTEARRLQTRLQELRTEIRAMSGNLRADRDLLRAQVERLRATQGTRRQTLDHLVEVREEFRRVRDGFRRLDADARHPRGTAAQETLQRLEWKLQTARLTRAEEKELVTQVREWARKLALWKRAYGEREKLTRLGETLTRLRTRLGELDLVREEARRRVQEFKRRISGLQARRQQVFDEAHGVERDLDELASRADATDGDLARLRAQRRELLSNQRAAEAEKRRARERQALKDVQDMARGKLREGRKLTFEELRVLLAEDEPELLK